MCHFSAASQRIITCVHVFIFCVPHCSNKRQFAHPQFNRSHQELVSLATFFVIFRHVPLPVSPICALQKTANRRAAGGVSANPAGHETLLSGAERPALAA